MTKGMQTVIYPVRDLARAKVLFGHILGVDPIMDQPYYVGYRVAGQDVGLDPNGHDKGMPGPVGYWHVDDINKTVQQLLESGAQVQQAINDVGGGKLIATVTDSDNNVIGLIQEA
jgi:predicted enzyme related to lactoylglutathione lyase